MCGCFVFLGRISYPSLNSLDFLIWNQLPEPFLWRERAREEDRLFALLIETLGESRIAVGVYLNPKICKKTIGQLSRYKFCDYPLFLSGHVLQQLNYAFQPPALRKECRVFDYLAHSIFDSIINVIKKSGHIAFSSS